ncbi:unnamed protein product [Heligmosomoides polygyrus]|uniref:Secreted protein n=1 Tax=Heligmosomoides polygyrus TaxID=6339 RepID=A0A183GIA7_HELPZ|nr:unnamed protein product [Heligmosomoides polygyrus]
MAVTLPCIEAKLILITSLSNVTRQERIAWTSDQSRRSASDRGVLDFGVMRLIALDWGVVLLLQLSFAVNPEMCAQLCACKYAMVRNRVTASTAVLSIHRRPRQRDTMGPIATFDLSPVAPRRDGHAMRPN